MQMNNTIKNLSKFTKVSEEKISKYLETHDLLTLFEHPETINPTQNQLKNFKDLQRLNNLSKKLIVYDEYKFEDTLKSIPFLSGEFENMYDKEHFVVAYLDKENKLLGSEKISTGTLNASIVHPRDVMKKAIQYGSDRLILAHNHPSGDPAPSNEDRNITHRLEEVAKALDKKIIDHIIIGRNDYYSFREEGDITVNYKIEKTNTLSHKNILKKDTDKHINLLNKFTKITKTELKNILKDTSIKNFIKNPEEYISDKDNLQKINMLKELQNQYFSKANKFSIENTRIKSPDDIQDFIMTRYDNYDNINVALYLDTKNTIIESEILPENLTSKEEAKHIIEKAILHDSNSFALSTKTNASHIRYSEESIDRVSNIKRLADLVGINLIDNVAVNKLSSLSYKGSHLLEPKEKYKAKTREKVKKEKPKFNVEELKNKTKSSTQNKQVEKRKKSRSL